MAYAALYSSKIVEGEDTNISISDVVAEMDDKYEFQSGGASSKMLIGFKDSEENVITEITISKGDKVIVTPIYTVSDDIWCANIQGVWREIRFNSNKSAIEVGEIVENIEPDVVGLVLLSQDDDKVKIVSNSTGTQIEIEGKEEVTNLQLIASYNNGESKILDVTVENVLLAKDVLKVNLDANTLEGKSPYVIYEATKNIDDTTNGETNEILCRVLYNDDGHGLQLISVNPVRNVTLGANDSIYVTATSTDLEEAQNSYNNAIENLNNYAEEYINSLTTLDARCIGSLPSLNTEGTGFGKKDDAITGTRNDLE